MSPEQIAVAKPIVRYATLGIFIVVIFEMVIRLVMLLLWMGEHR